MALQPGRPPALAAARRSAGEDGSNMVVVCWTASLRPAPVCSAPETRALMDLTGRAPNRDLRSRSPGAYAARSGGFRSVRPRLRHRALLGDIKVVGAFELHASSRASRFTLVVDIVRRHHPVVIVGSGSRALCSYTCVQILIGHHDAWSPLGRQTWARPRVHASRESPCMFCTLSCFACVLF